MVFPLIPCPGLQLQHSPPATLQGTTRSCERCGSWKSSPIVSVRLRAHNHLPVTGKTCLLLSLVGLHRYHDDENRVVLTCNCCSSRGHLYSHTSLFPALLFALKIWLPHWQQQRGTESKSTKAEMEVRAI